MFNSRLSQIVIPIHGLNLTEVMGNEDSQLTYG